MSVVERDPIPGCNCRRYRTKGPVTGPASRWCIYQLPVYIPACAPGAALGARLYQAGSVPDGGISVTDVQESNWEEQRGRNHRNNRNKRKGMDVVMSLTKCTCK